MTDLLAQPPLDLMERGAKATSDRRLFMQLQVYTACEDAAEFARRFEPLAHHGDDSLHIVVYQHVNDPRGVGVLAASEEPLELVDRFAPALQARTAGLTHQPHYTMLGRTYSLGYEADLEDTLLRRPLRHALNVDWPWAIWYPLRRSGEFLRLPEEEQRAILREHGTLGMQFGRAGAAYDIRLACHGLDPADNDFVIGLMGPELAPLSKLVERMRGTTQTSLYLKRLGPFFVGRAIWRSAVAPGAATP